MKKITNQKTNLVISADHGGFELKENLKKFLAQKYPELNVIDVGAFEFDAEDDFPDMTSELSEKIYSGNADKGIAICGSGVGASIVANKKKGIRAAVCHDVYSAAQGVQHNNMNVLCISDPNAKTSCNLVKVRTGSYQDPPELPGDGAGLLHQRRGGLQPVVLHPPGQGPGGGVLDPGDLQR